MSEIDAFGVVVAKLSFDLDENSARPVNLRVKPDRRQLHALFPRGLERRASQLQSNQMPEVAVLAGASRSRNRT